MTSLHMCDVWSGSHFSIHDPDPQPINWKSVYNSGIRGVIVKSTEGLDYVNPFLVEDAKGASAAGLHVGFYHYCLPGVSDAADQADYAMQHIDGLPRDIGLSCDYEETQGLTWSQSSRWCQNFLSRVAQRNIGSPLYSNGYFLTNMEGAPFGHKLWYAAPGKASPGRQCWMWQYGAAKVPGIPKETTDLDIYYG